MANGTHLAHLTESLKTCHDHIAQQESTNVVVQQQLTELTEMFHTFMATQPRPPPERPPPDEAPQYPLPFAPGRADQHLQAREGCAGPDGRDERRFHRDHLRQGGLDGWDVRDDRQLCFEDDYPEHHREDRLFPAHPFLLDFPRFDGDNPANWSYKANQFFEYYQTLLYQRIHMASFHMEGEPLI
jgi:hypothetical protein